MIDDHHLTQSKRKHQLSETLLSSASEQIQKCDETPTLSAHTLDQKSNKRSRSAALAAIEKVSSQRTAPDENILSTGSERGQCLWSRLPLESLSPTALTPESLSVKLKNPGEIIAQIKEKPRANSKQNTTSDPALSNHSATQSSINLNPNDLTMLPSYSLTNYSALDLNQTPLLRHNQFDTPASSPIPEQTTKQKEPCHSDRHSDLSLDSSENEGHSSYLTTEMDSISPTVFYTKLKTAIENNPQDCEDLFSYLESLTKCQYYCPNWVEWTDPRHHRHPQYNRAHEISKLILAGFPTGSVNLVTLALVNGRFRALLNIASYLYESIEIEFDTSIGLIFECPRDYFSNHFEVIIEHLNEFVTFFELSGYEYRFLGEKLLSGGNHRLYFAKMLTRFGHADYYHLFAKKAPLDFALDNHSLLLLGHEAIMSNQQDVVEKLNKKCLQINSIPLLHLMAQDRRYAPTVLEIFNEKGDAPFKQKACGMTPVMFAAKSGNNKFFDYLGEKLDLAEPVHTDMHGNNLLHLTVKERKFYATKYLLKISKSAHTLRAAKNNEGRVPEYYSPEKSKPKYGGNSYWNLFCK